MSGSLNVRLPSQPSKLSYGTRPVVYNVKETREYFGADIVLLSKECYRYTD